MLVAEENVMILHNNSNPLRMKDKKALCLEGSSNIVQHLQVLSVSVIDQRQAAWCFKTTLAELNKILKAKLTSSEYDFNKAKIVAAPKLDHLKSISCLKLKNREKNKKYQICETISK